VEAEEEPRPSRIQRQADGEQGDLPCFSRGPRPPDCPRPQPLQSGSRGQTAWAASSRHKPARTGLFRAKGVGTKCCRLPWFAWFAVAEPSGWRRVLRKAKLEGSAVIFTVRVPGIAVFPNSGVVARALFVRSQPFVSNKWLCRPSSPRGVISGKSIGSGSRQVHGSQSVLRPKKGISPRPANIPPRPLVFRAASPRIWRLLRARFTLPHGHGTIAAVPFDLAPRRAPGVERLQRISRSTSASQISQVLDNERVGLLIGTI
jgi:hypothetical protein